MSVVAIAEDGSGTVDLDGVRHAVDLTLIENPRVGDAVIVHAGFAIERLDRMEADARIDLFRQLAESRPPSDAPPPADPGAA